jgi:hypothetical protein
LNTTSAIREKAWQNIVRVDQQQYFPGIFDFLDLKKRTLKETPSLLAKLNLFQDKDDILKVKSKFERWRNDEYFCFPVLLSPKSYLVKLIILHTHNESAHGGSYAILTKLRKQFFVPTFFFNCEKASAGMRNL